MAQITIADEQSQTLVSLASEHGMTPNELVEAMIEQWERQDQLAFWGEGIVERVRRQVAETERGSRHMSEEGFLRDLEEIAR
jgi:hypothetical protein